MASYVGCLPPLLQTGGGTGSSTASSCGRGPTIRTTKLATPIQAQSTRATSRDFDYKVRAAATFRLDAAPRPYRRDGRAAATLRLDAVPASYRCATPLPLVRRVRREWDNEQLYPWRKARAATATGFR